MMSVPSNPLPTMAQIDAIATAGACCFLSDVALNDALNGVAFAIDPETLGNELHLRCEVDRCGLTEERLKEIESLLWADASRRNDMAAPMRLDGGPIVLS